MTVHVLHIAQTDIYDTATTPMEALTTMDNTYSANTWHYTDGNTGQVPDLHHLIMYKSLGGGEQLGKFSLLLLLLFYIFCV